jgi:hypothetical protein
MQQCVLAQTLALLCLLADHSRFAVDERSDRLVISHDGQLVAEFVFRDDVIRRPYFANVHAPGGLAVTRHHPPRAGADAMDHDTMHPGIWLGFGDISGHDFWRNKARIEHVRFTTRPMLSGDQLTFATESRLLTADDKPLCELDSRFTLAARPAGWLLVWDATFRSDERDFTFGDQEEMGFGARVATRLIETNGGLVVNSQGAKTAEGTWGQAASWCDYAGKVDGRPAGMTLMAGPNNFRESWWHNRDYGLIVANPFGRAAMKQGEPSAVLVKRGEPFRLTFAALLHSGIDYDPAAAYQDCEQMLK